ALPDDGAEGARQGGGRQVGHGGADQVDERPLVGLGGLGLGAVGADDVGGGRAEQLPAADAAGGGDALGGVVGAADGGEDLLLQVGAGTRPEPRPVAEQRHRLGGAHQQVGGEPPGGQHPGEVLGGGALVAQQPQVPGRLAERVGDVAEVEQSGVRVGGVGEPAEEDGQQGALDGRLAGDTAGERFQVPQGGGRGGVAEGDQAFAGRVGAEPGLTGRELGDRVEQRPVDQLLVQPPHHRGVPLPLPGQARDRVGAQAEGAAEAAQVGLVVGDQVGAAQP